MKRGQVTVIALFSTGILILGILLVASSASGFFQSAQGDDAFVNILLDWSWYIIGVAAVLSFFVYIAVVRGR